MTKLLLGMLVFLGVHSTSIVAPDWRKRMISRLGPGPWKGLYALGSLLGFVLLVSGYAATRAAPVPLYVPPASLRWATALLMLPVFPLFIATYLPGRIKAALKHPTLVATKLWAAAHLLSNGMLADVVLFGGFLAWAVLDRISVGRRPLTRARTADIPPAAADAIAVLLGLGLYAVFVAVLHARLIGVAPLG
ncbi:MAG: NnrU family protein [Steroidobacteraceae bacterium]